VVPRFLQEVARVLRPGGLFLSAEWGVHPTLHPEHPSLADGDAYIPKTVSFYKAASCVGIFSSHPRSCTVLKHRFRHRDMVPSLAPQILRLIRQTTSYEEPVSKQWAIPISTPYTPETPPSVAFVSWVMGRITQGYADALVAGGSLQREHADAFKYERDQGFGIYITYQTVFARKKSSG
jgi:SAM-dependent methyltransferase